MAPVDIRTHEVTFCGRVKSWADELFREHANLPFKRVDIEETLKKTRKRSDLRVYDKSDKLVLAGEAKLPGTFEGRDPYHHAFVQDAYSKADQAQAQFFFTWNVNKLVLFDRSLWDKSLYEKRIQEYDLGLNLQAPDDVGRPAVEANVQTFIAEFFTEFAQIVSGAKPDWGMAPDEYFIRAFNSHISWPVKLTSEFLLAKSESDKGFDAHLQEWMAREQGWLVIRTPEGWRELVDRAARTICYVFANRLIFYEAVRTKFENLKRLELRSSVKTPAQLNDHFNTAFQHAIDESGDYETIFYASQKDWAGPLIFQHPDSADAWRSVLGNLKPFNFKEIRTDVLGGIFKRLIAPEERHRFGQYYTSEDLVDVVNSFCIRKGDAIVLDPACGSGSFLVRAYYRKALKDQSVTHQQRLREIYGADIAVFAAHLATLNLAARDITDEENYPRIARKNFFEIKKDKPFCVLPGGFSGERTKEPIELPTVHAVVGNPPYVRQEAIPRRGQKGAKETHTKEYMRELCERAWPGLKLSGRSDLHCYFWPHAASFLREDGWFGFLVSSSWLDVEYGFALQEWALRNFRIHAILESTAEPWFEDARVKTRAVIMQRCKDETERMLNAVKFVRLTVPLRAILGERVDESSRQKAAEQFRKLITETKQDTVRSNFRIIVKSQSELWSEGLRVARLFELQKQRQDADDRSIAEMENDLEDDDEIDERNETTQDAFGTVLPSGYGGGKWGKYLRAPDLYFQIMQRYGNRFIQFGEIAAIRFGVKSGCDAFFMPRNVSAKFLKNYPTTQDWKDAPIYSHCKRSEVETGRVKLIMAGNGTVHPVESEYLAPEVHSLMKVRRPVITAAELDRLMLAVGDSLENLRGTHVKKYLDYGAKTPFVSKKSRALPVKDRSTVAARDPWYDLTYTTPGVFFWPMAQQYRHVIPSNPEGLICNHNLFDVHPYQLDDQALGVLQAVVNSTLVANFKTFYGRFAGTEGNLKTEVIDVNLLEIPDPRNARPELAARLRNAFARLCERDTQPMVEEEFMGCRSSDRAEKLKELPINLPAELEMSDRRELDVAVFELIGVADRAERERLCDQLYFETAKHFREIRIVEIKKQEQRAKSEGRGFRIDELALDIWDALTDDERLSVPQWIESNFAQDWAVGIPDGNPKLPDAQDMLDATTVFFSSKKGTRAARLTCPTREHAEVIYQLGKLGIRGNVTLPTAAENIARELSKRLSSIDQRVDELARSRSTDESRIEDLAALLKHWMILGKPKHT
jgi:methylase of polypeptide subunit release factors